MNYEEKMRQQYLKRDRTREKEAKDKDKRDDMVNTFMDSMNSKMLGRMRKFEIKKF